MCSPSVAFGLQIFAFGNLFAEFATITFYQDFYKVLINILILLNILRRFLHKLFYSLKSPFVPIILTKIVATEFHILPSI